jgi:uncharacterized protein (UPF0332 family)
MNVSRLLARATRNLRSAGLLLADLDYSGACNRVYYGAFDAAKAALLAMNTLVDVAGIKTHAGLIQAFGLHLVKTGKVSSDLGKILSRLEHTRMLADYADADVKAEHAATALEQGEEFVEAMRKIVAAGDHAENGAMPEL